MTEKAKTALADKKDDSEGDKGCIYQIETKTQASKSRHAAGIYISSTYNRSVDHIPVRHTGRFVRIHTGNCHYSLITVLFANFAEAIAEGRAESSGRLLRAAKRDATAYKILSLREKDRITEVPSVSLKRRCCNRKGRTADSCRW